MMERTSSKRRSLIIGDTHGHLDRLEALLKQGGLIDEHGLPTDERYGVETIQLGDLGHYGADTQARDRDIWERAPAWLDVILWGNHDRAVIDGRHFFMGYQKPFPETVEAINKAVKDGQLLLAREAHGFLLTHAGLHASYKYNKAPQESAAATAEWLNAHEDEDSQDQDFLAIRDAISRTRGGRSTNGGILWRDASESLYKPYRQVFGHSAKDKVRTYQTGKTGNSFCVDVGNQFNGRLAAIWLPSEEVVEVNLNKNETWAKGLREEQARLLHERHLDQIETPDIPLF